MATRRKFLGYLGIGAASAPLAAKEMMDGEVGRLAGIKDGWLSSEGGIAEAAENAQFDPSSGIGGQLNKAAGYLKRFGKLPDHVERTMRDRARDVRYLDYDIASKRSWSLAVKVMTQRERNYEREVIRYQEGDTYTEAQKAFEASTGFKWPW